MPLADLKIKNAVAKKNILTYLVEKGKKHNSKTAHPCRYV